VLISDVQKSCPGFSYPNLICSSPNTLWEGKTFNAVQNITILTVPEDFWQNHPNGAWLVYSWTGGVGGNAIGIEVDKTKFDSWFNQLSAEQKNTPIPCPLNGYVPPSNQPPEIKSFTATATKTADGALQVTFTCEAEDPDGSITFYQWDFGDGQTETTTDNTIEHTYTQQGLYRAKVTVRDNQGATAVSNYFLILITPGEINDDIITLNAPKAIIQILQ
jgi:PKD repeat protein